MSIYSSLWRIKIDLDWDNWVEVYAQGVDAHIGQPSEGYETDPYADFLPPIVSPYDPKEWPKPMRRAVVIVARG